MYLAIKLSGQHTESWYYSASYSYWVLLREKKSVVYSYGKVPEELGWSFKEVAAL